MTPTRLTLEVAVKTIQNIAIPRPAPAPLDAEHNLIAAIFHRAILDLKPNTEPYAQAAARRFWRGDAGELAWWCDLLDLNMTQVQRRIRALYPDLWTPRQLELALREAS